VRATGALTLACTKRADQEQGSTREVEGGNLTWAKPIEATVLDPTTSLLGSSWEILNVVYDRLVTLDDDLNVAPALATTWEETSPTHYVFTLRDDATFSNGRALTADDVVATFEHYLDPQSGSIAGALIGRDTKVGKVGDHQVEFTLSRPNVDFLQALTATFMSVLPMKEVESGEIDLEHDLLGTGSFMVDSHRENHEWVLKRNPHAWQKPGLDSVTVRIVPDDSARLAALQDGSVDMATFDLPDAPALLEGLPNTEVTVQDRTDYYLLQLNAISHPAFKDVRVRQAIAYALDRDRIREVALAGQGEPTGPASSTFGDRSCDLSTMPTYQRDVAKARQLLEESGHGQLDFEIIFRGEAFARIGQVVQQNLADIGVKVRLANLDEGVWLERAWLSNPSKMDASLSWYAGYGGPTLTMNWWNPGTAGFTAGLQQDDPAVNEAIAAAQQATTDPDAALQSACETLATQANQIPIMTKPVTVAYRSDQVKATIAPADGIINPLAHVASFAKIER